MKETVYIETSVVSYYTARPNRDVVIAGRQETTREYWSQINQRFECYVSALVLQEAQQGDATAAQARLAALQGLIQDGPIPHEYPEDALHIALAASNGIDYLLTWNFAHINNAQMKTQISHLIAEHGLESPIICTIDELMGEFL